MKKKFEELLIDMRLEVSPAMNPELGMAETLTTRRGIACRPHNMGTSTNPFDQMVEMMTWELRGGLRALKHRLMMDGYVEHDHPLPREEYLERIADELRAEGYNVIHSDEIDPDYGP